MQKTKPITPANMRKLATKLIDYLAKRSYWYEMGIYVDNERWSSEPSDDTEEMTTDAGNKYYVKKDVDIKSCLEYSNPKTISMYFEGPLYHCINYNDYDFLTKLDKALLAPYGLYFEQGYAWSAAAYE